MVSFERLETGHSRRAFGWKAPAPSGAFFRLVLQRKRAACGTVSPVIAALGGQNANRQSEQERGGGDSDYAFGRHGSPLVFLG